MNAVKIVVACVILTISCYAGVNLYHYFFDTGAPTIGITGLEQNSCYADTINCTVHASDEYKVCDLSVLLDNQDQILKRTRVNSANSKHPITINSKELSDGSHTITVTATNGTYVRRSSTKTVSFMVDNEPLRASLMQPAGGFKVLQGRTAHIKIQANKPVKQATVSFENTPFTCCRQSPTATIYECFIPINCEEKPSQYQLTATVKDSVGNTITLHDTVEVMAAQFRRQQLSVDAEKIKREKEMSMSNVQLEQTLETIAHSSQAEKLWQGSFYVPTDIKGISTEFGAIRVTQEKGRYYHKAVDIVNTPKSVIWAPQSGVVALKERYALSGNTVVIDHGCGICSLFFHLDDFAENIVVGHHIKQGNPIGTLGKTGYASGYHLHWEMRVNNIAVDPLQWTDVHF
ncbi:MAG: M23 family metallopeptidase [Candidatus Babeliales bacterium]